MPNYKVKPDYQLMAQAISRKPGLSGARHLEQGQDMSQGTLKGKGYFGEIPVNQGGVMTEQSSAYGQEGNLVSHPLLVPTLTNPEINSLLKDEHPSEEIVTKAVEFARQRIKAGKSPFAQKGEQAVTAAEKALTARSAEFGAGTPSLSAKEAASSAVGALRAASAEANKPPAIPDEIKTLIAKMDNGKATEAERRRVTRYKESNPATFTGQ